ncbi:MAG: ribonuclease III [Desulfatirhabdiaceae bacterium]
MSLVPFETLEQRLHYKFINPDLLHEALRHSSYVNEHPEQDPDNERLEFLGDSVINLIISDLLMKRNPPIKEGDMTRIRSQLVSESGLSSIARMLELGHFIQLGKGESQSNGQEKNSILADAMEALIAAVYLDSGFACAYSLMERLISPLFPADQSALSGQDYKSQLQELLQSDQKSIPQYRVVGETGPDHDKTFIVRITVDRLQAQGIGKNKKLAEQNAAKNALQLLAETGR